MERTHSKVVAVELRQVRQWLEEWVVPHLHVDKPRGTTGKRDRLSNPGFDYGEIKPENL